MNTQRQPAVDRYTYACTPPANRLGQQPPPHPRTVNIRWAAEKNVASVAAMKPGLCSMSRSRPGGGTAIGH